MNTSVAILLRKQAEFAVRQARDEWLDEMDELFGPVPEEDIQEAMEWFKD